MSKQNNKLTLTKALGEGYNFVMTNHYVERLAFPNVNLEVRGKVRWDSKLKENTVTIIEVWHTSPEGILKIFPYWFLTDEEYEHICSIIDRETDLESMESQQ